MSSLRSRELEKLFEKFLEKITELLQKSSDDVKGKWILYIPDDDQVHTFNTRDEALKYVYEHEYDHKYLFLIQIPFEGEESYYGFTKLILKYVGVDITTRQPKSE